MSNNTRVLPTKTEDRYLIEPITDPFGNVQQFACSFTLSTQTKADFDQLIRPKIEAEIEAGVRVTFKDGGVMLIFVLDPGKGEIFYNQIRAEGRLITDEEYDR